MPSADTMQAAPPATDIRPSIGASLRIPGAVGRCRTNITGNGISRTDLGARAPPTELGVKPRASEGTTTVRMAAEMANGINGQALEAAKKPRTTMRENGTDRPVLMADIPGGLLRVYAEKTAADFLIAIAQLKMRLGPSCRPL